MKLPSGSTDRLIDWHDKSLQESVQTRGIIIPPVNVLLARSLAGKGRARKTWNFVESWRCNALAGYVATDPITRSTTIDVEQSTTRMVERPTSTSVRVYWQTLAIRWLAGRPVSLSVICRAIIGRSFAEASLWPVPDEGYEIASLPRGVITKNQAKRPKSHHRASTRCVSAILARGHWHACHATSRRLSSPERERESCSSTSASNVVVCVCSFE